VIEENGINTDVGMDSDIGLYTDKEIETEDGTRMGMKQLFVAVVGS